MALSDAAVAEAAAVASTAHVATVQVGIRAAEETLKLWSAIVTSGPHRATSAAQFITRVMKVLKVRRSQAREIAYAGLRLERALRTGYTLPDINGAGEARRVRIDDLRRNFEKSVKDYVPDALKPIDKGKVERGPGWDELIRQWDKGSGGEAKVDPLKELERLWEEDEKRQYAEAKAKLEELVKYHQQQVEAEQKAARQRIRDEDEKARAERERKRHENTGKIAAGLAIQSAQDGGRDVHSTIAAKDKRAIGYVRVHNPVNGSKPCAFCALLLSRGPGFYKSAESAGGQVGSVHRYHPNCRCSGTAVYSIEQYNTDPRFAANREYEALYEKFKNKGDTVSRRIAWRNEIDHRNGVTKKRRTPLSRAQYARRMRARRQKKSKR